jgi:hypothetical protein
MAKHQRQCLYQHCVEHMGAPLPACLFVYTTLIVILEFLPYSLAVLSVNRLHDGF